VEAMIEFDDAGVGCPILGELYVGRRTETNRYAKAFISVNNKEKDSTLKALLQILEDLNVRDNEEILLCRGTVFDEFEQVLRRDGRNVKRGKIEGATDTLAEVLFTLELRKIGVPSVISLHKRGYGRFYHDVMIWYHTLYTGEDLLKPRKKEKKKPIDYVINRVCNYPHLMEILLREEVKKTSSKKKVKQIAH